jgi:hypothetical protein
MVNGQVSCEIVRLDVFQRILLRDKIADGLSAIMCTFASHFGEEQLHHIVHISLLLMIGESTRAIKKRTEFGHHNIQSVTSGVLFLNSFIQTARQDFYYNINKNTKNFTISFLIIVPQ